VVSHQQLFSLLVDIKQSVHIHGSFPSLRWYRMCWIYYCTVLC